jgi:hypothetical protein
MLYVAPVQVVSLDPSEFFVFITRCHRRKEAEKPELGHRSLLSSATVCFLRFR